MKRFVLPVISFLFLQLPVFANQPFKYKTPCFLQVGNTFMEDVCTVVETREKGGALKTRNFYSNKFVLTVKSSLTENGLINWDSHNKFQYKWEYKVGNVNGNTASYVMPGFLVQDLSWD